MLTMRRNWRIWRRGWCRCSLTWVASFFHRRCRWFATVHSPEGRLLPPSRLLHNCQSWTVNRTGVMTNHLYVSKKVANRIRAVDWHQFRWPWMTLNGRNAPFFTILHYIYRVFQCLLFKHPSAPPPLLRPQGSPILEPPRFAQLFLHCSLPRRQEKFVRSYKPLNL